MENADGTGKLTGPSRVSLVTAPRNDAWPDDEAPLVVEAFSRHGIRAETTPWHDAADWSQYDLIILRSGSWDTFIDDNGARRGEYFHWLEQAASRTALTINSPFIVQWVNDKRYMRQLEESGVPIVPTTFVEVGDNPEFPDAKFVVKPVIAAGSGGVGAYQAAGTEDARRHVAALHDRGLAAMIQPYVNTLHDPGLGERALVFFNGEFSYAVCKGPVVDVGEDPFAFRADDHPNPRLCELQYGDLDVGYATLRSLPHGERPFVARIDVVTYAGHSVLAEASIDDPVLFLDLAPNGTVDRYVEAAVAQWREHEYRSLPPRDRT